MPPSSEVIRHRLLARTRLRHWQGFARVAELGSVRKAAEALGLAQPALTGVLADLESLLGAPLFERHARGMRLTGLGHELLPVARSLLGAVADAAEQSAAMQSGGSGSVRIGAIEGAVSGLLTLALPLLAHRDPDLLVHVIEADAPQLDQLVARGEIDMALCRAPAIVPEGWVFEAVLHDRFLVVAGPGHRLVREGCVSLEQLRQETWLSTPAVSIARQMADALFGDAPPRQCRVSVRSTSLLWSMLAGGQLLALVPASVARQLLGAGELVEIPIAQPLPVDAIGALLRVHDARPGVQAALKALRQVPQMAASHSGRAP